MSQTAVFKATLNSAPQEDFCQSFFLVILYFSTLITRKTFVLIFAKEQKESEKNNVGTFFLAIAIPSSIELLHLLLPRLFLCFIN